MENGNKGERIQAPGLHKGVYVHPSFRSTKNYGVDADLDNMDEVSDLVEDDVQLEAASAADHLSDLGYVSPTDFDEQHLCHEGVRTRVFGVSNDLLDVDALQLREQGFVKGADMLVDTSVADAGLRIPDTFHVVGKDHFRQTKNSLHIPRTVKTFADFKEREARRTKKPVDGLEVILDRRATAAAARAVRPDYQE